MDNIDCFDLEISLENMEKLASKLISLALLYNQANIFYSILSSTSLSWCEEYFFLFKQKIIDEEDNIRFLISKIDEKDESIDLSTIKEGKHFYFYFYFILFLFLFYFIFIYYLLFIIYFFFFLFLFNLFYFLNLFFKFFYFFYNPGISTSLDQKNSMVKDKLLQLNNNRQNLSSTQVFIKEYFSHYSKITITFLQKIIDVSVLLRAADKVLKILFFLQDLLKNIIKERKELLSKNVPMHSKEFFLSTKRFNETLRFFESFSPLYSLVIKYKQVLINNKSTIVFKNIINSIKFFRESKLQNEINEEKKKN